MRTGRFRRGSTPVEMVIVMTIASILVSMAVSMCHKSILRMFECERRNNLFKAGAHDTLDLYGKTFEKAADGTPHAG